MSSSMPCISRVLWRATRLDLIKKVRSEASVGASICAILAARAPRPRLLPVAGCTASGACNTNGATGAAGASIIGTSLAWRRFSAPESCALSNFFSWPSLRRSLAEPPPRPPPCEDPWEDAAMRDTGIASRGLQALRPGDVLRGKVRAELRPRLEGSGGAASERTITLEWLQGIVNMHEECGRAQHVRGVHNVIARNHA